MYIVANLITTLCMNLKAMTHQYKNELIGKKIRQKDWEEKDYYVKVQYYDAKTIFGYDPLGELISFNLADPVTLSREYEIYDGGILFVHEYWSDTSIGEDYRFFHKIMTGKEWEEFKGTKDYLWINTKVVAN